MVVVRLGLVNPHVGDWGNETVGTEEISRANMSLPEPEWR